jgi:hypothetical protein
MRTPSVALFNPDAVPRVGEGAHKRSEVMYILEASLRHSSILAIRFLQFFPLFAASCCSFRAAISWSWACSTVGGGIPVEVQNLIPKCDCITALTPERQSFKLHKFKLCRRACTQAGHPEDRRQTSLRNITGNQVVNKLHKLLDCRIEAISDRQRQNHPGYPPWPASNGDN